MPRLLLVAPSAYPLGGVAVWLDYFLPGIQKAGWTATLALVEGPRFHSPDRYLAQHPLAPVIRVGSRTCTPEGRFRALAGSLVKFAPDIVLSINVPDAIAAVVRLRQKRRLSSRMAMALHGLSPAVIADAHFYGPALDGVMAVNRLGTAALADLAGISPERIFYTPSGTVLGPPPATRRPATPTLLYVGRFDENKRAGDLLDIARRLAQSDRTFQLAIAGDRPEDTHVRTSLAAVLGSRVRFLGLLSSNEVHSLQAQSDILIVTSACETGPLVIWEAWSAGMAVVSSRYLGSRREEALLDGRNALLFPVGDTVRATEQVKRLLDDPALRATLATAGRQTVSERFTIERSIDLWSGALHSVLALPPARGLPRRVNPPSGRLDHVLGNSLADRVRAVARRPHASADPGDEWPHTHNAQACGQTAEFQRECERLDREPTTIAGGSPNR